ncbi:MAG: efflux RND transporter periplasmic adaptor subunit [Pseudomonadota bacterium]
MADQTSDIEAGKTNPKRDPANANVRPSWARRSFRALGTLVVTLLFIALAGGAIHFGSSIIAERAQAVEPPAATEPIAVMTDQIEIVDTYQITRTFTGQIEAPQTVSLSFEQGGTLTEVTIDDGDQVTNGQVIARLDDRLLQAEITRQQASKRALEAQLELARLTDDRQSELLERGFATRQTADQTRLSIAELEARMAEIDAGLLAAEIQIEKSVITAPFDGRVNQRLVDPGTAVGGGQAIASLVENASPVFRVGVDPVLVGDLTIGDTISVTVGTSKTDAEIISILPQIDAATRTQIVRARLGESITSVFGATGRALFEQTISSRGAWVPISALEDGVRGLWTIKTVAEDEEGPSVGVEAVEIIFADSERAFVRGTFEDGDEYIPDGVHRVVAGQSVRLEEG